MFLYTSRWKMGPLLPTQAIPSWVSRPRCSLRPTQTIQTWVSVPRCSLRPTQTIRTWVSGPRCSLRHSNIPSPAGTAGPHQAVPRTTWRAWGHLPCHILPRSQARQKGAAAEESRSPTMPSQHIFPNTPSPPSHTTSHRECRNITTPLSRWACQMGSRTQHNTGRGTCPSTRKCGSSLRRDTSQACQHRRCRRRRTTSRPTLGSANTAPAVRIASAWAALSIHSTTRRTAMSIVRWASAASTGTATTAAPSPTGSTRTATPVVLAPTGSTKSAGSTATARSTETRSTAAPPAPPPSQAAAAPPRRLQCRRPRYLPSLRSKSPSPLQKPAPRRATRRQISARCSILSPRLSSSGSTCLRSHAMGSALHVLVATLAVVLGALCITPRGTWYRSGVRRR